MAIETDLAWLAGIVDGEGSIALETGRERAMTPRLTIGNTSRLMMTKIADILDELAVVGHCGIAARKRRPMGVCVLQGDAAVAVVQAIRPYLVAKAEQADVLLEYAEWRKEYPRNLGGRRAFPEEFHTKRQEYAVRIREPKHRREFEEGEVSWR